MSKRIYLYIILIVLIFAGLLAWLFITNLPKVSANADKLAQCLSEKGVVMYGTYWCPHCQNQKRLFGQSFKYIKYVECTQQPQLCAEKKINSYPTWDFADGSRVEGEMSFNQLAKKSACEIVSVN